MKRLGALIARLAKLGAEVAASKATRTVAVKLADRVGPHRALGKVGLVLIALGLLTVGGAWFFLTGGWFWFATISGIVSIAFGFALRGVNNLIVSLIVRVVEAIVNRVRNMVSARMQRHQSKGTQGPTASGVDGQSANPPAAVPPSDKK